MTTTRKPDKTVDSILKTIHQIKSTYPGLRIGQIIGNAIPTGMDPYYVSDVDLQLYLRIYLRIFQSQAGDGSKTGCSAIPFKF